MAAAAAEQIPTPPTYRFRPKKLELVKFYLLPLARGQDPFPGVIFEDDAAGSALPWDLFERHGVGSEREAYFIVRASEDKKPGARQDRGCDGGVGVWKAQSSVDKCLRVRGEEITVHVSNLNLHMGKGKDSGSVGWVMHEYTIAEPPCPSPVKICHISFSGHGRKRMRVPDGRQVCQSSAHARVASSNAASALPCSWAMLDHGSGVPYDSGDKEFSHLVLTDDDTFRQSPLVLDCSDLQCFPSAESEQYPELEAHVPHGRKRMRVPDGQEVCHSSGHARVVGAIASALPCFWAMFDHGSGVAYASGDEESSHLVLTDDDTFPQSPLLDSSDLQCFPSAASEQYPELEAQVTTTEQQELMVQQSTMPVAPRLSAGELEFWSSIGVDVQSNTSFEQEQSTGVQSSWVVPNNGAMATGVQSSWVVPNNGAMATGVQSSYVVPSIGAMATEVQNSWVVPNNGAMATGVQSSYVVPNNGAMATGVQSSYVVPNIGTMPTGVQNSWVVPNNDAMATGVQSSYVVPSNGAMADQDLDDFCRSLLAKVPTNCAVPDFGNMATRTLGAGCSLVCK